MSIYFYHLPKQNLVKIGCSSNVNKRLNQLSTGCTEQGVVLRVIEGFGFKAEKWLHEHFKALKVKGEWFRFTEDMLNIQVPLKLKNTTLPSWKPIGDGVENKHFKSYPYEETLLQLTSNEAALYSLILKGYIHNTGYSYVDLSTYTPSQKTEFSKGYKKLKERNLVKRVKKNTYLINPCAKIHLSLFDDLFEVWNKTV